MTPNKAFVAAGVLACLCVLVGANFSSSRREASAKLLRPSADIIVTRDNRKLPRSCRPRRMVKFIQKFLGRYNRGDGRGVARLFVLSQRGSWFSSAEVGLHHNTLFRKRDLAAYVRRRHLHQERLRLLIVDIGSEGELRRVGISFVLTRNADDLAPGFGGQARVAAGKGSVLCRRSPLIFIWNMGMTKAEEGELFPATLGWTSCPRPSGWQPLTGPIVACSRTSSRR